MSPFDELSALGAVEFLQLAHTVHKNDVTFPQEFLGDITLVKMIVGLRGGQDVYKRKPQYSGLPGGL